MEADKQLFNQIKTGNKQSFELLFKKYYAPLCKFAYQYIHDHDECEEIVQAFFTSIWEKRKQTDINKSIKNYLYNSVRNRCFNYIKHLKIKTNYQIEARFAEIENSNIFLEPGLIDRIHQSINELPNRRREIFILSREHGLKYREIAEKLDISVKTVEAQMGHALRELRDKLKEYRQFLVSFVIHHFISKE
jgi:RNA polymerase sigma-70 factor (ECF subfamily)